MGFTFFVGTDSHRYYTGLTRVRFQRNLRTILEYEERRIDYIILVAANAIRVKASRYDRLGPASSRHQLVFPTPSGSIFRINFNRTMFNASLAVRLMIPTGAKPAVTGHFAAILWASPT